MTGQSPGISWHQSGTPVSDRFGDPYFSVVNGLEETRHVFLRGNDLPARLRPGFHIAELGFGTGLNLLCLCRMMQELAAPPAVRFTSFEAFPMALADIARAHGVFAPLAPLSAELRAALGAGLTRFALGPVDVDLVIGDARDRLAGWPGRADAWFLDGFAPARNPELWQPSLLAEVAAHTAPGGTFATYTAAGHVRRTLAEVGFEVSRIAGYGTKRHMTTGRLGAPDAAS